MIDKRLDQQLVSLNTRYQELLYSSSNEDEIKKNRYLSNLKALDIGSIIEDLKYRKYAKQHFSTSGNISHEAIQKIDVSNIRIAVYCCIVGKYDTVIDPIYKEDDIDYFLFTDQDVPEKTAWKKIDLRYFDDYNILSSTQLNRKIKIIQTNELLKYDFTIYVDGNIEIVSGVSPIIANMGQKGLGVHYHRRRDCIYDEVIAVKHLKGIPGKDMDEQIKDYRNNGFPAHFGMYENSILIRDNRDKSTIGLMEAWWKEYLNYPTRDQLSLPYVIWKTGYDKRKIYIMGDDVERNPRFNRLYQHKYVRG